MDDLEWRKSQCLFGLRMMEQTQANLARNLAAATSEVVRDAYQRSYMDCTAEIVKYRKEYAEYL